jgi:hypothetical protein
MTDLTNSTIQRQNILNNKYALQRIQEYVGLEGMLFEGEYRFTKEMIADEFFQALIYLLKEFKLQTSANIFAWKECCSRGNIDFDCYRPVFERT